jgi:hypothetical protein
MNYISEFDFLQGKVIFFLPPLSDRLWGATSFLSDVIGTVSRG